MTVALQALEDRGTIGTKWGQITVVDRAKLEVVAAGIYGVPEAEYERLIGLPLSTRPVPNHPPIQS